MGSGLSTGNGDNLAMGRVISPRRVFSLATRTNPSAPRCTSVIRCNGPSLPTRSKDNLIPGQETSRNKLSLFETNWKKDGPNKRSTREFVEREQKALNDLWVRIQDSKWSFRRKLWLRSWQRHRRKATQSPSPRIKKTRRGDVTRPITKLSP